MKWSKPTAALLALTWSTTAWAGACCVGSTATNPARVGECEKTVVAIGLSGETAGTWTDRDGERHQSSINERSALANLGAGLRLNRQVQVGLSAPIRLNHFATSETAMWGGGLGDLRVTTLWDPVEEKPKTKKFSSPVPIFTAGMRLPTGRDWTESSAALHEDVTGLEQPAILAGAAIERSLDRWPWSVGTNAEVGVGARGAQPVIVSRGSLGKYFGSRWTVSGTVSHQMAWASLETGLKAATQTNAGLTVIRGTPGQWRGWLGAQTAVPLPGLNISTSQRTSVSTGVAIVL